MILSLMKEQLEKCGQIILTPTLSSIIAFSWLYMSNGLFCCFLNLAGSDKSVKDNA